MKDWSLAATFRGPGEAPAATQAGPLATAGWRSQTKGSGLLGLLGSQTFQNPLIKEYTLNYNRIPNMI